MLEKFESFLFEGLHSGYNQNLELQTSYYQVESVTEYLLTVVVAQRLLDWSRENGRHYSINLEFSSLEFFKQAFLPYMMVGDIFDIQTIHPEVLTLISSNVEIRVGRIDIVVNKENHKYDNFKESIFGVELKGINPAQEDVFEDILRLILALKLNDPKFENSILAGYCLHIKVLGGNQRISKDKSLEDAKAKYIENLQKSVNDKFVLYPEVKMEVSSRLIFKHSSEEISAQGNKDDYDSYRVGLETKIVFAVMIKIDRV